MSPWPRWAISRSSSGVAGRTLHAIEEDDPGTRWAGIHRDLSAGYTTWFLREGDAARPSAAVASKALREHMPEIHPVYERLVELAGGGDQAARLLALWCPTPYLTGCSQAVWRRATPLLVRNYDYLPGLWDGVLLSSKWTGRRVVGMLDSLWGVLDGMNEDGLAVSLAFGGRPVVGAGFGMPLILRYILETCHDVPEAVEVLLRVPSHMSYNVTLLDAQGRYRTVFVAPDRPTAVTHRSIATNHQRVVEWEAFAHATATLDRERHLRLRLADPLEDVTRFVGRFLEPPLFTMPGQRGWGTLYTAVYAPATSSMALHWTHGSLVETIGGFQETTVPISYVSPYSERIAS